MEVLNDLLLMLLVGNDCPWDMPLWDCTVQCLLNLLHFCHVVSWSLCQMCKHDWPCTPWCSWQLWLLLWCRTASVMAALVEVLTGYHCLSVWLLSLKISPSRWPWSQLCTCHWSAWIAFKNISIKSLTRQTLSASIWNLYFNDKSHILLKMEFFKSKH